VVNTTSQRTADALSERDVKYNLIEKATQDNRAVVLQGKDRSAIILDENKADATSLIHELAHEYELTLTDREVELVEQWSGTKKGTVEFREAFAKGAERYIYEGSFNSLVDRIFEKISQIFRRVIESSQQYFEGTKELSPEIRDIYANMLVRRGVKQGSMSELGAPQTSPAFSIGNVINKLIMDGKIEASCKL
jgi:hypothetical protein